MAAFFFALHMGPSPLKAMGKKTKNSAPKMDRVARTMEMITRRTALIRAIYIVSVAVDGPRDEILAEFHQAVGDVLEGMALTDLNLTYINKDMVRTEVAWLRERN